MEKVVYLAGTIDSGKDLGKTWRQIVRSCLEQKGFVFLDPTDEIESKTVAEQKASVDVSKKQKDWSTFNRLMDAIWESNSSMVTKSDFLIVHFTHSPENWSGGTMRELQLAFDLKKPVYLVYGEDTNRIKNHVLHMFVKYGQIFVSFDELFEKLLAV
jgi:nucleoside 2-deoxyribosyltransferase